MFRFHDPPAIIRRWQETSQQRWEVHEDQRERQTVEFLGEIFTPGAPIDKPDLFSGRRDLLARIREKLSTKGQNLVIYGDRGLGKTSLILVAFHQKKLIHHTCHEGASFQSIFLSILGQLNAQFSKVERSSKQSGGFDLGFKNLGKLSSKRDTSEKESAVAKEVLDPNFVAARLAHCKDLLDAIIIDEFQRVTDADEQQSVLDTVKILSDHGVHMPIIIIGHVISDAELFRVKAYQEHKGRYFAAIDVKEMSDEELTDIIVRREQFYGTAFTRQAIRAIVSIASGYPTVVHKLALSACNDQARQRRSKSEWGWTSAFVMFRKGMTFLDGSEWLVSQANVYPATSTYIAEERDSYQRAFIELIEQLSRNTAHSSEESHPEESIPIRLLRASGFIAKFHLGTHAEPMPSSLSFPDMNKVTREKVLRQWASRFFPNDLELSTEAVLAPNYAYRRWLTRA